MSPADVMNQSGARKSVMPIAIRAAPAALATLVGVLGLVFQTNPVRPYTDGAWAASDLVGLFVVGLVVGVLTRSVSGLVGMIVGASAAVAIQLFVLTEQASWTTNVVASLREPGWSPQVLWALAVGITSLIGGYVAGALGGLVAAAVRSRGPAVRPSAPIRHGAIAGLTLAGAALLAFVLVRAAATSAFVPSESEPVLQVTVQGDRISSVTPETIAAGRLTIDIQRTAGIKERWVSVEGPLTDDMEAVLLAGNDPQQPGGGLFRPFPATQDLVRIATRTELPPGRFAVIVSDGMAEMGPDDTAIPEVPALDARTLVVTGPELEARAATGGSIAAFGYQVALLITSWGTAGSLLVARRGRDRALAVSVGLVAAGLMWLLVGFTIHQSYAPL